MSRGEFTVVELCKARRIYGSFRICTKCGMVGSTDTFFGWRRMKPHSDEIRPQPQCYECRAESWKKDAPAAQKERTYRVNEVFFSLQGEGVRAGTANVFVRFSGCNLACSLESHGFDCDTEFVSGRSMSLVELCNAIQQVAGDCRWVVLTGGEPLLQVDAALMNALQDDLGFSVAIETNGSVPFKEGVEETKVGWLCVSPKVAEHSLADLKSVDELKYVRHRGQGIPKPRLYADHLLISPAFTADGLSRETLEWCIELVKENPEWRLSVQQHKTWRVR